MPRLFILRQQTDKNNNDQKCEHKNQEQFKAIINIINFVLTQIHFSYSITKTCPLVIHARIIIVFPFGARNVMIFSLNED